MNLTHENSPSVTLRLYCITVLAGNRLVPHGTGVPVPTRPFPGFTRRAREAAGAIFGVEIELVQRAAECRG